MTESEWLTDTDPTHMVAFLRIKPSDRKLRLFAVACCRRIDHLLTDERSRQAVLVGERWADGQATDEAIVQARDAARAVVDESTPEACAFAWHVLFVQAWHAANRTSRTVAMEVAWRAVPNPHPEREEDNDPERQLARESLYRKERGEHAKILRDIFGNPFRPVALNPSWLSHTIASLAQAIYDNRQLPSGHFDNQRMGILADALEEAGCDNADVLNHCRSAGPHVRGCWAVDLLLGKS